MTSRGQILGRRNRLLLVFVATTAAITLLAVKAAGQSMSYYVTPEEFAQQLDASGRRWRVGGRVVEGSILEERGRPVRFDIVGEHGEELTIDYPDGPLPNLFGPRAFVVVDGEVGEDGALDATRVVIKHEDEMVADS